MIVFLSILYILVCFLLVVAVLLQEGKGGGLSSAFGAGGGAGQTLFGAGGAGNFLTKATSILGGVFMLFSLLLALMSGTVTSRQQRSVLQPSAPAAVPSQPGSGPAPQAPVTPVPGQTAPGTVPPAGEGTAEPAPAESPAPAPGASEGTGN